ncbi:MAG: ATP-binding protein, partial [Azospirillaceae bacterium]
RVAAVVGRLADRPLDIRRDLDPAAVFLGDRSDLEEIAGNLIDNAAKWAADRVRVAVSAEPGRVVIAVEDDGPGIPADARGSVLAPGARLDERAPGSGLGLTIVAELADAYGGALVLGESEWGGLSARVELPGA